MPDPFVERSFYRNGQIHQERPLVNGQLHGLARTWHKNGVQASEEPYQEGKLRGTCRQWDATGKLLGSYVIDHGTGTQCEWWDNERLKMEVSTLEGVFHGISRQWLMDGTLVFKVYFVKGNQVTRDQYQQSAASLTNLPKDGGDEPAHPDTPGLALIEPQLFIESLLSRPNKAELRKWLSEAKAHRNKRSMGSFSQESQAVEFADALYRNGEVSVIAVDLYSNAEGDEFCDCLLIALPPGSAKRKAPREACTRLCAGRKASVQPDTDLGETHLYLALS
jgi:MORN repeat variant